MNTKRMFTARATAWLLAWHEHASRARFCLHAGRSRQSLRSARVHASHARTCLHNFRAYCNDKPYTNGIPQ